MLSFELSKEKDQLYIHGDPEGLRRFASLLNKLADLAESGDFPHEHFFSEAWGGDGFSLIPQEDNNECLNHVKMYGWPDEKGSKPYKKKLGSVAPGTPKALSSKGNLEDSDT